MKPSKARFSNNNAVLVALRNEKGEYLLQRRVNTGYLDGFHDFTATIIHSYVDDEVTLNKILRNKT